MPKSIDKSDVSIEKLFNWGKKYELEYRGKKFNTYVRLVGDAELNRARVFALRRSTEMRRKLRDENSDERMAFIPSFDVTSKEEIINGLLVVRTREYTMEAFREIKFNLPKEPDSDDTLEAREKYQKTVDDYPEERDKKIREYVNDRLEKDRKKLEKSTKETLYNDLISGLINQICETEMVNSFREMCTFYGTYKDENYSKRLFDTFEQFSNLPSDIKTQFINFYFELDMDIEDLKKLPEVVQ